MNIKVQLPDRVSAAALIENGLDFPEGDILTFHAYSDMMKARVLELIAAGQNVVVKPTTEEPRDGEWFENTQ
jgi:hypothetical protein